MFDVMHGDIKKLFCQDQHRSGEEMPMSWLRTILGLSADRKAHVSAAAQKAVPCSMIFDGDKSFAFEIVGESKYQEWLQQLAGPKCEDSCEKIVAVELRPEPTNLFDPNALQVVVQGGVVGYIPRIPAATLAGIMKQRGGPSQSARVFGMIVGGWLRQGSEGSFGVKLDLLWPPIILGSD